MLLNKILYKSSPVGRLARRDVFVNEKAMSVNSIFKLSINKTLNGGNCFTANLTIK